MYRSRQGIVPRTGDAVGMAPFDTSATLRSAWRRPIIGKERTKGPRDPWGLLAGTKTANLCGHDPGRTCRFRCLRANPPTATGPAGALNAADKRELSYRTSRGLLRPPTAWQVSLQIGKSGEKRLRWRLLPRLPDFPEGADGEGQSGNDSHGGDRMLSDDVAHGFSCRSGFFPGARTEIGCGLGHGFGVLVKIGIRACLSHRGFLPDSCVQGERGRSWRVPCCAVSAPIGHSRPSRTARRTAPGKEPD